MTIRARAFLTVLLSVSTSAVAACGGGGSDPMATSGGADGEANLASGESASSEDSQASREVDEAPAPTPGCPEGKWCSAMYPPEWTADAPADTEGRFLHDFSFAGYHYGEAPPATPPGATYDVVAGYGADATGGSDATAAVQSAIDAAAAAGGGIVYFPAGTYRIASSLTVSTSGIVLRGAGTSSVLRFTKATGAGAHLRFESPMIQRSNVMKLAADAPVRAREIFVADASTVAVGDDVSVGWTITPAFVTEHGMDGTWTTFNGKYEPFFRNRVAAVDTSVTPNKVTLEVPLRYTAKARDGAGLQKEGGYLKEVGLEHLAVSNATTWANAWAENSIDVILFRGVTDAWISDVHSVAMPGATGLNASDTRAYHLRSSGIKIEDAKRVSVLGSSMENAQNRGSGGNGYLFEVSRTNEVLFADDVAKNGRHNFIQNWGFGNAGTVFLRCVSQGSELLSLIGGKLVPEPGASEHHHSLAMATLVDGCEIDDAFKLENRGAWSDGAGHTATDSVVWGAKGTGTVVSKQYQWGYVIGTQAGMAVDTQVESRYGVGTAPEDWVEGRGQGDTLFPASLYQDQRARRMK